MRTGFSADDARDVYVCHNYCHSYDKGQADEVHYRLFLGGDAFASAGHLYQDEDDAAAVQHRQRQDVDDPRLSDSSAASWSSVTQPSC